MIRVAVVDMGSNTIRLALYELKDAKSTKYKKLIDIKSTAGLSNYIENEILTNDGINKASAVLKDHIERSINLGCDKILIFATAVLRNCKNRDTAKLAIESKINHKIDILSGEDEARLGLKGVMTATDAENGTLIDLGGGSCEITVFKNRDKIIDSTSISIGCISSYKTSVAGLFPTNREMTNISEDFTLSLHKNGIMDKVGAGHLYAIGGSVRAIAKLSAMIDMAGKPERYITKEQLDEILNLFKTNINKFAHLAVKAAPERLHSIIPGILIFKEIMQEANCNRIDILKRGVREGYLLSNL